MNKARQTNKMNLCDSCANNGVPPLTLLVSAILAFDSTSCQVWLNEAFLSNMTRKPMSELLSAEQTIIALIYMSKVAREDMHEFKMRSAKTAFTLSL